MWKSLFLIALFVFAGLLSHAARAVEVYDTITSGGEQDSANSVLGQCPVSCSP